MDGDLLRRLNTIAVAFAVATAATRAAAGLPPLTGVVIVVFDSADPPTLALEVDGVRVATRPMDIEAGPLIAVLVEHGLARLTADGQHAAATLLQSGRTTLVLCVPLGQERLSVHGVIVDREDPAAHVEVFALVEEPRHETVH